jgi:hypothetical protein
MPDRLTRFLPLPEGAPGGAWVACGLQASELVWWDLAVTMRCRAANPNPPAAATALTPKSTDGPHAAYSAPLKRELPADPTPYARLL